MADKWQLLQVNHINAIVDGYEATIEHFQDRLGFTLDHRIPDLGDGTNACLMTLAGVMFEFFAPKEKTNRGQGALLKRYGDFFVGIEYRVPDVAEARRFCEERDVRIIRDTGLAIFTHPESCFGVSVELWDGDFSEHSQPPGYWENDHPLGLSGLARLTVGVHSADVAASRLSELAHVTPIREVSRPNAAGKGVQLQVGDAVWELLEPTGEGAIEHHLARYGERIRSAVFKASDMARVEKQLTAQGFDLITGDADGTLAIKPEQNKNLLFEFDQQ